VKAADPVFSKAELTQIFAALKDVPRFAIAVSGGGDSLALMRLALEWRSGPGGIIALTVDHALRPGSAAEAARVSQWCQALGIEHHTLHWQHEKLNTGLQAKARVGRYDLLSAWCQQHKIPALLTAHTVEDQAETVAMRQNRTTSPRSLAGIWPETDWNGVQVLRLLLAQTRAKLRQYLTSINQTWLEDPSNANTAFERVRVRNAKPSSSLADIATTSQIAITTAQNNARMWMAAELTIAATGMLQFAPQALTALDPLAQDEALHHLITMSGGTVPERSRRTALLGWLNSAQSGRRTLGGALFSKRKRHIFVTREAARIAASPQLLHDPLPILWDKRFSISGPSGSSVTSMNTIKHMKRLLEIPAAVWSGLPVVTRGPEVLAYPQGLNHPQVKIEFIKK